MRRPDREIYIVPYIAVGVVTFLAGWTVAINFDKPPANPYYACNFHNGSDQTPVYGVCRDDLEHYFATTPAPTPACNPFNPGCKPAGP